MLIEMRADRQGCRLIEKNPHSSRVFWQPIETANGKLNHCLDLLAIESSVPLHQILDVGTGLEVFKNGRYRHPCAF